MKVGVIAKPVKEARDRLLLLFLSRSFSRNISVTGRERERTAWLKSRKLKPEILARAIFLDIGAREFMAGTTFRHAGN